MIHLPLYRIERQDWNVDSRHRARHFGRRSEAQKTGLDWQLRKLNHLEADLNSSTLLMSQIPMDAKPGPGFPKPLDPAGAERPMRGIPSACASANCAGMVSKSVLARTGSAAMCPPSG